MISVHFQSKSFNIKIIQVYAPTTNAKEAEVEWFYEDLEDLLETGKFVLGVQSEAGQRLTENALVIDNTLFEQHKR